MDWKLVKTWPYNYIIGGIKDLTDKGSGQERIIPELCGSCSGLGNSYFFITSKSKWLNVGGY